MARVDRPSFGNAVTLVALAWSARRAHTDTVSRSEERIFRSVNRAPDELRLPVWLVMQSGSLAAVFVTAAAARRCNTRRGSRTVAFCGTAVWAAIKAIKPLVGRGRPEHHLDAVNVRGAPPSGLGYPSGHAAVATTLAMFATRPGPARVAGLSVACATGAARMYVGAHLPLDVVGGIAIARLTVGAADAVIDRCGSA